MLRQGRQHPCPHFSQTRPKRRRKPSDVSGPPLSPRHGRGREARAAGDPGFSPSFRGEKRKRARQWVSRSP
ncbi:MAG: hypothetical protein EOP20_09000 [Hyphomicrobiales bacterium]|nr:MAG: hypothetical protein EOP20_09000 [Hyphomicrobiales bacterium]